MSLAAAAGRGPGAVWSPTHVQVTVLQARGLRAKGPGGTSDAYAVIQVGKEKYATSVSERSLGAPVWREEATFELPPLLSGEAAAAATLQLTVLHRALLGLDKFLGRAEVDLRELHRDRGRRKTRWFTLKSKPGKKEKDRGEIEVDIQFMRNNMTASMFDLSVKDKSRNPFGKLKDKIKGKNKDSASDTASAIVPSSLPSVDSDDESSLKDKKKKSKIKTLFSKSTLQKTPLSQSMSVLPTSKADKELLRPGGFQSRWGDDDEDNEQEPSSAASDVLSHKRTASADPKQLSQINFTLPRKDGLSFLGGLRSKNDLLSRSNVCINGNHVYVEQPEAKSEARDSSPSSSPSPQSSRKKHLFSSTENLAARSWKESGEGGAMSSDKRPSETPATDALKSTSLPPNWPPVPGDTGESPVPSHLETSRETKETKKQEGKKSSLLSLVTGKKDVARTSEGDSPPAVPRKEKEAKEDGPRPVEALMQRAEKDVTAVVSGRSPSMNPFEEVHIAEAEAGPESKSEPPQPVATARTPQTKAVKPRAEASPDPPPAAMLPSAPDSTLCISALASVAAPSHPETRCSGSPLPCPPLSSPLAAPVSTSTPVESWPPADQGQAGARPPSLLLPAEGQRADLTHTPDPAQWGSLSQGPLGAERDALEGFLTAETPQTGWGGSVSREHAEEPLPQQPEAGHREGRGASCPGRHDPPPGEALLLGRGPDADMQREPRACVSRAGADGEGGSLPLPSRDSSAALGGPEAQKKTKKRVSFSEQLFTEDDTERWPGPQEEDPQEPTREGTAASNVPREQSPEWPHTPEPGRDKARPAPSVETPSQEGPSEGGSPLSLEGDDALLAQNQSKASDHEGALSDPLEDLQSRVTASLDLSLPPIPEVASDDERVDPSEGDGDAAPWGVGTPSQGRAPASPERGAGPRGGAGGLVTTSGSPCDLNPTVPDTSVSASPVRPSALGAGEADPGTHSGPNRQSLGPGSGEEAKVLGSGWVSRTPCGAPDSPVARPSFSETFPATRSVSNSPHSDTPLLSTAESQTKATAEGKAERSSKRKPLLQAWVAPSEAARHRPHPVKPMNSTAAKVTNSSLGTATIISENLINEAMMKKYNPSDPAFAYAQLTHDELIQLVLKQKEAISKKEFQVRELEDYIDNLLVRVMEETPNILRVPTQVGKKAGKM